MTFLQAVSKGLTDAFKIVTRLAPHVSYLVALWASKIDLVDNVGVYLIVDWSNYNMVTSLMAWDTMKCVDWETIFSFSTSQLLPFVINTGILSFHSEEGFVRVVQNASVLMPQPRQTEVPFLRPLRS